MALGRDDEALVTLRKALYLDPDDGVAHFQLAGALARAGHSSAAAREYRAAAAVAARRPDDAPAPELEGRTGGRVRRAVRAARRRSSRAATTRRARRHEHGRRHGATEPGSLVDGLVTFRLGGREYATRLDDVREVVRLQGLARPARHAPAAGRRARPAGRRPAGARPARRGCRRRRRARAGRCAARRLRRCAGRRRRRPGARRGRRRRADPGRLRRRGRAARLRQAVLRGADGVVFLVDLEQMVQAVGGGSASRPAQT